MSCLDVLHHPLRRARTASAGPDVDPTGPIGAVNPRGPAALTTTSSLSPAAPEVGLVVQEEVIATILQAIVSATTSATRVSIAAVVEVDTIRVASISAATGVAIDVATLGTGQHDEKHAASGASGTVGKLSTLDSRHHDGPGPRSISSIVETTESAVSW